MAGIRAKEVRLAHVAARPGDFPRDGLPEFALCGRSNVGKSSLLNRLLGRAGLARVSKTPGRTREIFFYAVDRRFYLVDLPGFGYARVPERMRRAWSRLVESYLDGRESLRLAIHLVDARHEPTSLDRLLRDALEARGVRSAVVLTKGDKLRAAARARASARARAALGLPPETPVLLTSARTGEGLAELARLVLGGLEDARGLGGAPAKGVR
ncbi:MAG: YihA family ribosome biogenesis GTP-binding protein [Acidobacteria bacterium]|nr:MAG: YihA family ribosome biogenesis GTP-binding protein [Acidobacteriota bacterium]